MRKNIDLGLLVLRLTLGVLMLLHGIAKLSSGLDGIKGKLAEIGLPEFIAYGVHIGEFVAPLLLIIGFRTRVAAVIFGVNMVVALLLAHSSDIFSLSKSGGWAVELIGLYLFGSLCLFFTGGGKWSVSTSSKWD